MNLFSSNASEMMWPYPIRWDETTQIDTDVLVLGGGVAGCWAAISAARRGAKVVLVEKGATIRSGASGTGCDHWESVATNPCSGVTPEELTDAMLLAHRGYNNGISHFIECNEGYDRVLDMESLGGKVRDTEGLFTGAEFRDDATKFLFAYDYVNRFTLRIWGTTFKPALARACRDLGVQVCDRTMAMSLLTEEGKQGSRIIGATGFNVRTGEFYVFRSKAAVLAMSRPTRVWLFSSGLSGISEFRPPQCTGDGHAMAWEAGAEFTMMEKAIRAEWSGERSFPPYGTGNNHNTWFACSMVDARGRGIPWVDRDGNNLKTVSERYRPAPGQHFFLKGGGEPDFPIYDYQGPDTLPVDALLKQGFKLPFYADLSTMPEMERKAIWGLMVGEEGKTKIPILKNYTDAGFNPETDWLQSYGTGWKSGAFLPQERQYFGIPGGLMHDWHLQTSLEGLYAAGDQLFASNCHGHAAATGHYAGRHASNFAKNISHSEPNARQIQSERERFFAPIQRKNGIGWKELNSGIARLMQHHCGGIKEEGLMRTGLNLLQRMYEDDVPALCARNPHELMRSLEITSIMRVAELILQSSLAREASSKWLHFERSDYPEIDPPDWTGFVTVRQDKGQVIRDKKSLDFWGNIRQHYEETNSDYVKGTGDEYGESLRGH